MSNAIQAARNVTANLTAMVQPLAWELSMLGACSFILGVFAALGHVVLGS